MPGKSRPLAQSSLPLRVPDHAYIYVLVEPDTRRPRYVGKTVDPKKRLTAHSSPSSAKAISRLGRWLNHLRMDGTSPVMRVLDMVRLDPRPFALWEAAEQAWIRDMRFAGANLVNHAKGGEGPAGGRPLHRSRRLTPAQRAEMSVRLTGIPKPSLSGERNCNTTLLESEVVAIREARAAGETYAAIAQRFGTTKAAVAGIATGKAWKYAPGPIKPFQPKTLMTPALVVEMRELGATGVSGRDLADKFGIDPSTVTEILTGAAWRDAGGPIRSARAFHKLTPAEIALICAARRSGESALSISERLGTPIASVYNAIKRGKQQSG